MSLAGAISTSRQAVLPTKASYTEDTIPDLTDKVPLFLMNPMLGLTIQVVVVTGANTGVGKQTARILYGKNANVYLMARSEDKTVAAISDIKTANPSSKGSLHFVPLDLADMTTIRSSVDAFLARESRLDLLFNNAGVAFPKGNPKTKQGYELQLGVNTIGPFGLTKMLEPTLNETAKTSPKGSVRVIWLSSSAAEAATVKGFVPSLDRQASKGVFDQYSTSKFGTYLHASEFSARNKHGVLSMSVNPGNLDSELWRSQGAVMSFLLRRLMLNPVVYGASTSLFAAFAPEVAAASAERQAVHGESRTDRLSIF